MGPIREARPPDIEPVHGGGREMIKTCEFVVAEPLDPTWGYWLINASNTAPSVMSGVAAGFSQDRYGGIAIAGHVAIQCKAVNEILSELPEESRLKYESADSLRRSFIDICGFGDFQVPPYTGLTHVITEVDHVESAVRWFIERFRVVV